MIALPSGVRVAMHSGTPPHLAWVVVAAPAGIEPQPGAMIRMGEVSAVLTHDRGLSRPNRQGQALAEATLAEGGVVTFGFCCLEDAIHCAGWLRKAGAQ